MKGKGGGVCVGAVDGGSSVGVAFSVSSNAALCVSLREEITRNPRARAVR